MDNQYSADPPRRKIVAVIACAWMLAIDSASRLNLGSISLSGILTISCLIVLVCMWFDEHAAAMRRERYAPNGVVRTGTPVAMWLFLIYVLISTLQNPSVDAIQNGAVYAIFVFGCSYGAISASQSTVSFTMTGLRWTGILAAGIYLGTLLLGANLYDGRSIALTAVVCLAVVVPFPGRRFWNIAFAAIIVLTIVLSLSRTALLVALALLVFLVVRSGRRHRTLKGITMVILAASFVYVLVFTYDPIRQRFLGGDNGAVIDGVRLNTSGRSTLWSITWNSILQSPWFGHGTGSASALISSIFPNIGHPHNDYLRLLHDFGFVGASLFALGAVIIIIRLAAKAVSQDLPVQWSGLMAFVGMLACMITDNIIVYAFIMFPTGYLVGLALASDRVGLKLTSVDAAGLAYRSGADLRRLQ